VMGGGRISTIWSRVSFFRPRLPFCVRKVDMA
jgi:hypothetical protein